MSIFDTLLGHETSGEKDLSTYSKAPFDSRQIQAFLPEYLRSGNINPYMNAGIAGIGNLMQNPGGLNPNISQAIAPRLGIESQGIAQNFRGIQANQAGGAARSNLPVSIKAALDAALNTQQERAQRDARGNAMYESEQLRRSDLDQTYKLLDALLQFSNAGRGGAIQGLGQAANSSVNRQAATQAMYASMLQSIAGMGKVG